MVTRNSCSSQALFCGFMRINSQRFGIGRAKRGAPQMREVAGLRVIFIFLFFHTRPRGLTLVRIKKNFSLSPHTGLMKTTCKTTTTTLHSPVVAKSLAQRRNPRLGSMLYFYGRFIGHKKVCSSPYFLHSTLVYSRARSL